MIELNDRLITSISVSDERAIDQILGIIIERAIDLFLVIKRQVWLHRETSWPSFDGPICVLIDSFGKSRKGDTVNYPLFATSLSVPSI